MVKDAASSWAVVAVARAEALARIQRIASEAGLCEAMAMPVPLPVVIVMFHALCGFLKGRTGVVRLNEI